MKEAKAQSVTIPFLLSGVKGTVSGILRQQCISKKPTTCSSSF
jgi:hypothetical protein